MNPRILAAMEAIDEAFALLGARVFRKADDDELSEAVEMVREARDAMRRAANESEPSRPRLRLVGSQEH